jgi:hypothetical protein
VPFADWAALAAARADPASVGAGPDADAIEGVMHEALEPRPALAERQRPQVLAVLGQEVVGPDMGGEILQRSPSRAPSTASC